LQNSSVTTLSEIRVAGVIKPIQGWIVEGTVASGKTTLLQALQQVLISQHPARTKFFVSEHYTERVLEDVKASKCLTAEDVLSHAEAIVQELENIAQWKLNSKFRENTGNAVIDVTLERFLGSHYSNLVLSDRWIIDAVGEAKIRSIYQRLAHLGFAIVILALPEALIGKAVATTRQFRNAAWSQYLDSIGNDEQIEAFSVHW
jgi:Ni2+-binding GTPase involved in maturation of urease and hydrogenase